jgi:hypothetical protein
MTKPQTGAERIAKHRANGRAVAVVLRDQTAIDALDKLAEKHGGVTAGITAALIHAAAAKRST